MKSIIERDGEKVSVTLEGRLYVEESADLRERLLQTVADGGKYFTVNMEGLEFIDTTGVGVFISVYRKIKPVGGAVVFEGVKGAVKELIYMLGMDKIFCGAR